MNIFRRLLSSRKNEDSIDKALQDAWNHIPAPFRSNSPLTSNKEYYAACEEYMNQHHYILPDKSKPQPWFAEALKAVKGNTAQEKETNKIALLEKMYEQFDKKHTEYCQFLNDALQSANDILGQVWIKEVRDTKPRTRDGDGKIVYDGMAHEEMTRIRTRLKAPIPFNEEDPKHRYDDTHARANELELYLLPAAKMNETSKDTTIQQKREEFGIYLPLLTPLYERIRIINTTTQVLQEYRNRCEVLLAATRRRTA